LSSLTTLLLPAFQKNISMAEYGLSGTGCIEPYLFLFTAVNMSLQAYHPLFYYLVALPETEDELRHRPPVPSPSDRTGK
jgi:hypothetical protein